MKKECNSIEEAEAIVMTLIAEEKWDVAVLQLPGNKLLVQWLERKKYVAQDGKEYFDELWTTEKNEMKHIQDIEPEHARNILRMILRNARKNEEAINTLMDNLRDMGYTDFAPHTVTLH